MTPKELVDILTEEDKLEGLKAVSYTHLTLPTSGWV